MTTKKPFHDDERNTVAVKLRLPWNVAKQLKRCAEEQETTLSNCVVKMIQSSTIAIGHDRCQPSDDQ